MPSPLRYGRRDRCSACDERCAGVSCQTKLKIESVRLASRCAKVTQAEPLLAKRAIHSTCDDAVADVAGVSLEATASDESHEISFDDRASRSDERKSVPRSARGLDHCARFGCCGDAERATREPLGQRGVGNAAGRGALKSRYKRIEVVWEDSDVAHGRASSVRELTVAVHKHEPRLHGTRWKRHAVTS